MIMMYGIGILWHFIAVTFGSFDHMIYVSVAKKELASWQH